MRDSIEPRIFILDCLLLDLLYRVAGESATEFLEYLAVDLAEHHCRVYLAALELRKLVKGLAAVLVLDAEH